jgi:hypothetical protein
MRGGYANRLIERKISLSTEANAYSKEGLSPEFKRTMLSNGLE